MTGRRFVTIPQSVIDRAELLARSHPLYVVAELVKLHPSQLSEIKKRGWKAVDYSCKIRPLPADFSLYANRLSFDELVKHYRAGEHTVVRWLKECPRPSRRGMALKRDHKTGKRNWELRQAERLEGRRI